MTLAGSILFIGYIGWEKVLGKAMTQSMRYRALKITMLAYVVPWVWLKETYKHIVGLLWHEEVIAGAKGLVDVADIETNEIAYQTEEYQLLMLVMVIWFAIAVLFLLIRSIRYLRKRHGLHILAIKCEDKNLEKALDDLWKVIQYKRRPEVVWTRVNNETFTIGAFKPVIFLQKEYAEGELYWILKHEMIHIVRKDLMVKLLLEFVCCLHWFNPLIYFLEHKLKYLCETSCDERVLESCTEEERQIYMNLLDRNKGGNKLKIPFGSALESGSKEIDKRIHVIKTRRDIGCKEKTILTVIFGVLVFLDSLTALAYPDVHHVKNAVTEAAEDSMDGGNFWIYDCAEDGYGMSMDVILYDKQFVDENGEIYPMRSTEGQKTCSEHDTISGIVQIHEKDNNGGCTIETYEGTRCIKCGIVWTGEFDYKISKTSCIH